MTSSNSSDNPVDYTEKFEKELEEKSALEAKEETDKTICPRCGGKLVIRHGKYGTFLGCSNYPRCRYTREIGR